MKGKLYGVSVGPGKPELITMHSKEIIEKCDVIGYPVKKTGEKSTALFIIESVVDLKNKDVREFVFSMDPKNEVRREHEKIAIDKLQSILESGKNVALVTLDDVGIYSTYMYVDRAICDRGFDTEVIPGVNSFSHGAAIAGLPLTLGDESLCVIPMINGKEETLHVALDNFENIVYVKSN